MTYQNSPPRGLYRSREDCILFGVCGGLAEYFQMPPWGVRAVLLLLTICTGVFPMLVAYIVAGMVMKPRPFMTGVAQDEFTVLCHGSRSLALQRIKQRYEELEQRLQKMESVVTSSSFDYEEQVRRR